MIGYALPVTAHSGDVQRDVRTSDPALGTLQRFTGAHRGDYVVDRLGFRAGVVWVVHEGTMGRPRYDAMKAVGRERDRLLLVSHPSLGVIKLGGQDDQWLRIEAAETPRLGHELTRR